MPVNGPAASNQAARSTASVADSVAIDISNTVSNGAGVVASPSVLPQPISSNPIVETITPATSPDNNSSAYYLNQVNSIRHGKYSKVDVKAIQN